MKVSDFSNLPAPDREPKRSNVNKIQFLIGHIFMIIMGLLVALCQTFGHVCGK